MGFTLIEVLVVVGIFTVIFGFAVGIGSNFYGSQSVIAERYSLVSILRIARSQALNNINEANHGVFIGASQYTLFEGDSYAARNQDFDSAFPKSKSMNLSGLSEIVFNSPQGDSNVSGTITISGGSGIAAGGARSVSVGSFVEARREDARARCATDWLHP